MRRWVRVGFGLALVLASAACASRPPRPAMVAQAAPDGFGYSQIQLSADRSEIRYLTPELPLPVDDVRRLSALNEQKQRAYDLALWRAAQIALERGYAALSIEQDHRDADVVFKRQIVPAAGGVYGLYGPGGMWGYGPPYCCPRPGFASPFWFYNDPFAYETRLSVSGRIDVRLVVLFSKAARPGSLDAATTAQRLSKQYAGATY
jgi:hypothetical protein